MRASRVVYYHTLSTYYPLTLRHHSLLAVSQVPDTSRTAVTSSMRQQPTGATTGTPRAGSGPLSDARVVPGGLLTTDTIPPPQQDLPPEPTVLYAAAGALVLLLAGGALVAGCLLSAVMRLWADERGADGAVETSRSLRRLGAYPRRGGSGPRHHRVRTSEDDDEAREAEADAWRSQTRGKNSK